ncbi:MAG: redoxin domain-containing protein [Candidatus Latescibacterota bacterium]|jgi:peroxiredoxin
MAANVGDSAPGFSLKNTDLQDVSLADYAGKNVVLLFVPLAFTGVCTQELCDISAGINAYDDLGAQVLGISVDSPFSLKAWAEKEGITIPLLSDFNKEVSAAYGAQFEDLMGLKGIAKRSAFVVDGAGTIRYASVSDDPKILPDFAAIKACLQSLN